MKLGIFYLIIAAFALISLFTWIVQESPSDWWQILLFGIVVVVFPLVYFGLIRVKLALAMRAEKVKYEKTRQNN